MAASMPPTAQSQSATSLSLGASWELLFAAASSTMQLQPGMEQCWDPRWVMLCPMLLERKSSSLVSAHPIFSPSAAWDHVYLH